MAVLAKIYDENYSTQTQVFGKEYTVRYNLKGKTDKALAGKEIVFRTQEYAGIRITINEDGTFEFSGDVIQNGLNNSFYFDYPIHVDRQQIHKD